MPWAISTQRSDEQIKKESTVFNKHATMSQLSQCECGPEETEQLVDTLRGDAGGRVVVDDRLYFWRECGLIEASSVFGEVESESKSHYFANITPERDYIISFSYFYTRMNLYLIHFVTFIPE
jgi:hypothetical protein